MSFTVIKNLCLALALSTAANVAFAGFNIVQNGVTYRCEETGSGDGLGAIDCAEKAYAGPFSRAESTELCKGAYDTSPADCAAKAYAGSFNKAQSLELCVGARNSTGPADCAAKAYAGPFSSAESLRLCKKNGDIRRAECAAKAYAGPYNKEEAIALCTSGNSGLLIRSFDLMQQSQDTKARILDIKLKLKQKDNVQKEIEI